MKQIAIPELNEDTAGILALVARGETIEITDRDRPVARLVPLDPALLASPPPIRKPEPAIDSNDIDLGIRDHESW